MDLKLQDRVAFVAGSSRGIGLAIAQVLLTEGARVVVTGRDAARLAKAESELVRQFGRERVLGLAGDLAEAETIQSHIRNTKERWGGIQILVANIGTGRGQTGWQVPEVEWGRLFEVNFWTSVRLVNAVLPDLIEAHSGSIVLISSITGLESTLAPLPYSVAKAALVHYTKNLARQVGLHQVRVNCVAPGNVLFPGGSWEQHLSQRRAEVMHYIENEVPLQRFGRPEEIADLVAFLASDRAAFITGACVVADGGQTRST